MAVHMTDLYNFTDCLGLSIVLIGVLNVCRVRSLFEFLYKFLTHGGVRPLCGLVKFLTHGGVRPLCGLV